MGERPGLLGLALRLQYDLNPIRCHLMTVLGCTIGQRGAPVRPKAGEVHPEDLIAWTQLRTFDRLFADSQLLTQGQVLDGQVDSGNEYHPEKQHSRFQHAHCRPIVHRRKLAVLGRRRPQGKRYKPLTANEDGIMNRDSGEKAGGRSSIAFFARGNDTLKVVTRGKRFLLRPNDG